MLSVLSSGFHHAHRSYKVKVEVIQRHNGHLWFCHVPMLSQLSAHFILMSLWCFHLKWLILTLWFFTLRGSFYTSQGLNAAESRTSKWGPLDPSNLKDDLSGDVRFYTHFAKTSKNHFTSNDLTCDKTWMQICTQNDDITRHKSRNGVSFASGYS